MWLKSDNFEDGKPIPGDNAFCIPTKEGHATFAPNRNPQLRWDEVPDGTRSFALLMVDVDAPTVGDDVNQEGREVSADLPRTDFTHWALVDLPGHVKSIDEGVYSDRVTPGGKSGLTGQPNEGVNDYSGWFASDPEMAGAYKGYDGPCPPWNDSIPHHYVFTLFALDVEELDVGENFNAEDVVQSTRSHVLAEAKLTGTYTLNPRLETS